MAEKIKAFTYMRFSSAKQIGNSSIDRQDGALTRWLEAHDDVVVMDSYIDEAMSAWKGKHIENGSLGRLLKAIEDGLVPSGSLILVEHFSRLSRMSQDETTDLIRQIWDAGITIITVEDNAVYSPEDRDDLAKRLRLVVEIDKAYSDSKWRSTKVKQSYVNREEKAKEGITPAMRRPFWLDKSGKLNENAEIIKDVFSLYLSGLGQMLILYNLRKKYPKNVTIKKLSPPTIIRWITSETIRGMWRGQKVYDHVVEDDIFYAAQNIHIKRSNENVKADRKWPLSGLIQCGYCDAGMSIQQSGDSLPVLRCSTRQRTNISKCKDAGMHTTFPYLVAHQYFFTRVKRHALKRYTSNSHLKDSNIELNEIAANLVKLKNQLVEEKGFYKALKDEGKSGRAALMLLSETDEEIEKLEKRQKVLTQEILNHESMNTSDEALELIDDPLTFNFAMHRLGIKLVIKDRIIKFEDNLGFEFKGYCRKTREYICNDLAKDEKVNIINPQDHECLLLNKQIRTVKSANIKRNKMRELKEHDPEGYRKHVQGVVKTFKDVLGTKKE
jgi:hypothetical protein